MKPQVIAALALAAGLAGHVPDQKAQAKSTPAKHGARSRGLKTLAAFKAIRKNMSRSQVHALAGKPASITGSGLSIGVYELKDKSKVWIAWGDPSPISRLFYVKHRSPRGDKDLLK